MKIKAFAKVNLSLDVTGRRADGYHEIRSVMQSVSLCDEICVEPADNITLTCSDSSLSGENNLAFRAAKLFFRNTGVNGGAEIYVEKHIPAAAGLGGGSADAAAVLTALAALYGVNDEQLLLRTALSLGADVPFCLRGGTALAEGIGEILRPLRPFPSCRMVIIKKGEKSSTGDMYRALDAVELRRPDTEKVLAGIENGDLTAVCRAAYNCFEQVCDVSDVTSQIQKHGALYCGLSGAGPSVVGIFENEVPAELFNTGLETYLCTPVALGNEIFV